VVGISVLYWFIPSYKPGAVPGPATKSELGERIMNDQFPKTELWYSDEITKESYVVFEHKMSLTSIQQFLKIHGMDYEVFEDAPIAMYPDKDQDGNPIERHLLAQVRKFSGIDDLLSFMKSTRMIVHSMFCFTDPRFGKVTYKLRHFPL
jgi:hypothetical protein